ncbi:hypothetical protein [Curtobacterium ammoniigenes]|uniref:hypothetical protein n=1 Tax=Curtobacterium ammoniigenes TaxID=395387 RepID=UPI0012EEBA83|nr:hypothetical protein [Curtobacterium ammoniigenes]
MAGRHEGPRDAARTDGVVSEGGEYVDSEIPGDAPVSHDGRAGEYVESEIPGEVEPDRAGVGAYDQSEIPGEQTPVDEGVGHYVDSEIPGDRDEADAEPGARD